MNLLDRPEATVRRRVEGLKFRILSTLGAATVGLLVASAVVYDSYGHVDAAAGLPVRGVRSPCDLVPQELVGRLLHRTAIGSDYRMFDPGESGTVYESCDFQQLDGSGTLDLDLRRSGPEFTYDKKKQKIRPAVDVAREAYETAVTEQRTRCHLRQVQVGERAVACIAPGFAAPRYLLIAGRSDLVVTVTAEPLPPGGADLIGQIAAAELGAA
jgi:hypothetical protein